MYTNASEFTVFGTSIVKSIILSRAVYIVMQSKTVRSSSQWIYAQRKHVLYINSAVAYFTLYLDLVLSSLLQPFQILRQELPQFMSRK